MFSVADLTKKFHELDDEGKSIAFEQLTRNAVAYNKIMPEIPLLKYILEGEQGVPLKSQGPIINAYKAWLADPVNWTKLKN